MADAPEDKADGHWLNEPAILERWKQLIQPRYLGFYSTLLKGFTREPWAIQVPIDDHMVHRGDGVFEAIRVQARGIFDLEAHLERLERSAETIALQLPMSHEKIISICLDLCRLVNNNDLLLRLFVSRGPGSFTTNPYDCSQSQLYVVATELRLPAASSYDQGVRVAISRVPPKEPFYSRIKSCNYLPNVLMKKESVDRQVDFTVSVNEQGQMCEGSTENFALVTHAGELCVPPFDYTLRGTTLLCVMELARQCGILVAQRHITAQEITSAAELVLVGTTLGVLPITEWEGKKVGSGRVGPIAKKLQNLLMSEMSSGEQRRHVF